MSLNGLDSQLVADAHTAASEPGAWFILNYAARDEVELLDQGSGGLPEVRKAVENYTETSPLYGFLRYRRRVVIIRYLPEGCSRLIQARVAVHFTAVCERFSPYDSTLEITHADELSDTKLSATCSLHAASASNASSSNSSRRRRLGEIAEVDEEEQQKRASKRISLSGKAGIDEQTQQQPPEESRVTSPEPAVTLDSALAASPEATKFSAASTTEVPNFVGTATEEDDVTPSVTDEGYADRRMSSQSGRPAYPFSKPKVKLAPRPSFDVANRPQTAGNFRPVSSIPAGLKLFGNKSNNTTKKSKTESSSSSPTTEKGSFANFGNNPEEQLGGSTRQLVDAARPATSSGASLAPKSPGAMSTATVKAGVTPEKARLMKAMRMREKKMKKTKGEPPVPSLPGEGEAPVEPTEEETKKEEVKEEPASTTETAATPTTTVANTDEASVLTSSSRPGSPIVGGSDADQSTKASSISESTDGTVEAKDGAVAAEESLKAESALETTVATAPQEQPVAAASTPKTESATTASSPPKAESPAMTTATATDMESQTKQGARPLKLDTNTAELSTDGAMREKSSVEALPSCWSPFKTSFQFGDHDQLTPEALVETKWVAEVARAQAEEKEEAKEADAGEKVEEAQRAKENQETLAKLSSKFSSQNLNKPETEEAAPVEEEEEESAEIVIMNMADEPSSTAPAAKLSSKFSSQKSLTPEQSTQENVTQSIEEPETLKPEIKEGDEHSEAETIQPENKPDLKVNVEPIRASMDSHTRTETDFGDDEALLDELQGATVEEARPMTVQTPLTPAFPSAFNGATPSPSVTNNNSPGKPPSSRGSHMVRTVSNPVRGNLMLPTDVSQSSARSMSGGAAYLHKITQQQQAGANLANKKTNMGSGISQRIKALEMLSVEPKETLSVGSGGAAGARPSSAFFSVKKGRTPSRSPSVMERATNFGRNDTSSAASTREVSPDTHGNPQARPQRERSTSVASRLSMFESSHPATSSGGGGGSGAANHSPSPLAGSPRGRTESVSVTARIVRDPDTVLKAPEDPSQFGHLDLKQSAITVDHQRASPPSPQQQQQQQQQSGPMEAMAKLTAGHMPRHERTISRDSILSDDKGDGAKAARRSSLSVVKGFIKERRRSVTSNDGRRSPTKSPTLPPNVNTNTNTSSSGGGGGISSRLSFTSVRTSFSKDREMGATVTSPTLPDDDDNHSITSEKRQSRAGRFMSRLSNLGSRGKLTPSSSNQLATTVTEEEIPINHSSSSHPSQQQRPATTATSTAPAIVSHLGDVNVQFPDNLLWKRRNLALDAAGFIILSTSAAFSSSSTVASKAAGLKRYHLSDFRRPVVPDVEVQELPNSVVLDFVSGGGLQFACEDRSGQMGVLQVLSEAHGKHALMF